MQFPISVLCEDVSGKAGKRIDMIHRFDTEKEYMDWIKQVEQWDELTGKPSKRTIVEAQEPTMIVHIAV